MIMFVGRSQEIKIHKSKKDLSYVFLNNIPCECGAPAVSYTVQVTTRQVINNAGSGGGGSTINRYCFTFHPCRPLVHLPMQCLRGADVPNADTTSWMRPFLLAPPLSFQSGQSMCISSPIQAGWVKYVDRVGGRFKKVKEILARNRRQRCLSL